MSQLCPECDILEVSKNICGDKSDTHLKLIGPFHCHGSCDCFCHDWQEATLKAYRSKRGQRAEDSLQDDDED